MNEKKTAWALLTTFFRFGWKNKRSRIFLLFSLIPVLLLLLVKIMQTARPASFTSAADLFSNIMLIFYFQLLIPVLALFFGSSVINDEIDNKTLVYLTVRPVPRWLVFTGKYVAYLLVMGLITFLGLVLSFLIANFDLLASAESWRQLLTYLAAALLAITAYSGLFALLASFMRKSILIGLFFVFGWESIVQYFPGTTQKFTIIHFVKSLLPYAPQKSGFLIFQLEPSPVFSSVLVLMLFSLITLIAAAIVFQKKEYILSDSN